MSSTPPTRVDLVLLLLALAGLLFLSPFTTWWAEQAQNGWLTPFFFWGVLIFCIAKANRSQ